MFGLEEIPAWDEDEDGEVRAVAPAMSRTVIRAPEGTHESLFWAADEFVAQCGPDWTVSAVLLEWLRIEAGEATRLGVESCLLERVSADRVRLHATFSQWEQADVPIAQVRRMLIDLAHFLTREERKPLPAWRIRRLGERDFTRKRRTG